MFQRIICIKSFFILFLALITSAANADISCVDPDFFLLLLLFVFLVIKLSILISSSSPECPLCPELYPLRSEPSFSSSQSLFSSCNAATDLLCEIAFIELRNLLLFSTSFLHDLLLLLLAVDESITPNDLRLLFDSSSGLYLSQGHIRLVYRLTVML
eukprot:554834_1